MFSSEIKETVYIAVSLMILSLVLGMVVVVTDIRSDFANIRNAEITTAKQMSEYRKYNKYDDRVITGADIIALVREIQDLGVEIYVDKLNGGAFYHLTQAMVVTDKSIIDIGNLQQLIKLNYVYHVYLRYDFENVKSVAVPVNKSNGYGTVTGISIKYLNEK